jgi:hypothetical protein
VTSGQLVAEYGFTDIDASRPDVWRYNQRSGRQHRERFQIREGRSIDPLL